MLTLFHSDNILLLKKYQLFRKLTVPETKQYFENFIIDLIYLKLYLYHFETRTKILYIQYIQINKQICLLSDYCIPLLYFCTECICFSFSAVFFLVFSEYRTLFYLFEYVFVLNLKLGNYIFLVVNFLDFS